MGFKVNARVLLELGAELISSDSIAIYELVKNAIDAKSPSVDVRIFVALTASGHRLLSQELSTRTTPLDDAFLESAISRHFEPSAPNITREQFRKRLHGLRSDKALDRLTAFYREFTYIEIEDWGHGMNVDDLNDIYLVVGTSHRAKQRLAAPDDELVLGEKGIGRLSAMRLGQVLEVISGKRGEPAWSCLEIDWESISNLDASIADVQVRPARGGAKEATDKGTLIRVRHLNGDWSRNRLAEIAAAELSKLKNPFVAQDVLDLTLSFNEADLPAFVEIDVDQLEKWHGKIEVSFGYDMIEGQQVPKLTGRVYFRVPDPSDPKAPPILDFRDINSTADDLYSVMSDRHFPAVQDGKQHSAARFDGITTLGPFTATAYWFNRLRAKGELGTDYHNFGEWLKRWSGGLLLYRDGYRVYPYAGPDDDWLELDQKALRARSYKLNRGQFVGYVAITSRGNPHLKDQTNRQGLVDTPEKRVLIQALQQVIWKEFGGLLRKYEDQASRPQTPVKEIDTTVKARANSAKAQLRALAKEVPDQRELIGSLRSHVEELEAAWSKAKAHIRRKNQENETYLHLAGIGMLLEFIVHELSRVTTTTLDDLRRVKKEALPPALRSMSRQLQTLDKRLRILDPVATPGRQRKEQTDIVDVIDTLVEAHDLQFERHKIRCQPAESHPEKAFTAKVVAGQMYQIFENLISNSVYWLTHHQALLGDDGKFKAEIKIDINAAERTITFRDNGPGIHPADRPKLFEAFFSKRPSGRGLGLFILKNLCDENGIAVEVGPPDEDGRFRQFVFTLQG